MAAEDIPRMIAAMEQMNQRINDLQEELNHVRNRNPDNPRETSLIDKNIRPEIFGGINYHTWSEDFTSIVAAKKPHIAEAMKWGVTMRDQTITVDEVLLNTHANENDDKELYVYLMHHLTGEPRIIAKASDGSGVDAWRRLKVRYDPITEVSQVGLMLQALQPPRASSIKGLMSIIEKWEEGLRRQHAILGESPLTDGTKRAILVKMAPAELATHLQLNAPRLDSYDKMRWEIVNYINLKAPMEPMAMQVDAFDDGDNEDYDIDAFGYTKGKNNEKGKGKGKWGRATGGQGGQGKGEFRGVCFWCGENGHRAAECNKKKEWQSRHGKGKGKGKNQLNEFAADDNEEEETGILEICAIEKTCDNSANTKGKPATNDVPRKHSHIENGPSATKHTHEKNNLLTANYMLWEEEAENMRWQDELCTTAPPFLQPQGRRRIPRCRYRCDRARGIWGGMWEPVLRHPGPRCSSPLWTLQRGREHPPEHRVRGPRTSRKPT